jgi:hypothetical protein
MTQQTNEARWLARRIEEWTLQMKGFTSDVPIELINKYREAFDLTTQAGLELARFEDSKEDKQA